MLRWSRLGWGGFDVVAAGAVAGRIDWKYALGLELAVPGFDHSVLSEFRGRLAEHDLARLCFDRILNRYRDLGWSKPAASSAPTPRT